MGGHTGLCVAAVVWLTACTQLDSSNGEVSRFATNDIQRLGEVDVSTYVLDIHLMQQWSAATRELKLAAASDPGIARAIRPLDQEPLIRFIMRIESNPAARDILSTNGLTPREYVMITRAYLLALTAEDRLRAAQPAAPPANVNAANIDFVRQHRAELDRLTSRDDSS